MRGRRYRKALRYRLNILSLPPPPPPHSPRPLASPSKMAEIKSFLLLSSVILSMDLSFSARIAGFSGFYSGSHYFTIKKVMEELFSRGHEVRVFRTRCGPNYRKKILETCVYRLLKVIFIRENAPYFAFCNVLHLKCRFFCRASEISDLVTYRFGPQPKEHGDHTSS